MTHPCGFINTLTNLKLKKKKRQAIYIKRNIKARSYNHYGSGKAISITVPKCVFVALVFQYAVRMRPIIVCKLSGFTVLFHNIAQSAES